MALGSSRGFQPILVVLADVQLYIMSCSVTLQDNNHKRHQPFFALAAVGRPTAKFVSSNGRHLKSFLYPPQVTFRRLHWSQDGLVSSHFRRLALHVMHPRREQTYPVSSPTRQFSSDPKSYRCDFWSVLASGCSAWPAWATQAFPARRPGPWRASQGRWTGMGF